MNPFDALGPYGCVPRDLHPAWKDLRWSAALMGKALFAEVVDFSRMVIATHGDWMNSLCKRLGIDGKERRYAKPALQELVAVGLLTVGNGFVTIHINPVDVSKNVSQEIRSDAQEHVTRRSDDARWTFKTTQVLENTQTQLALLNILREEERAPARETTATASPSPSPSLSPDSAADDSRKMWGRRTFGEPPLGFNEAPAPKQGWVRFWELFEQAQGVPAGSIGHAFDHRNELERLSLAVERACGVGHGEQYDRAVQRLLGAWLADPWVAERPWAKTPANLRKNLGRYASAYANPAKSVVAAAPAAPTDGREALRRIEERRALIAREAAARAATSKEPVAVSA